MGDIGRVVRVFPLDVEVTVENGSHNIKILLLIAPRGSQAIKTVLIVVIGPLVYFLKFV